MTIRTREEAAKAAENTHTNHVGWCQIVVRGYFNAPSAGDVDGDGASDAEDGWKKEPAWAKHFDRHPPRGVPVSFVGGRNDFGHRAISLGHGVIRSTDFDGTTNSYRAGVVGNGTIDQVARAMGVSYAGWSDTIDGVRIPEPPPPSRGDRIDESIKDQKGILRRLKTARANTKPNEKIRRAFLDRSIALTERTIRALKKIPFINR